MDFTREEFFRKLRLVLSNDMFLVSAFLLGKNTVAGLICSAICVVTGLGIILATCLSDHDFEYKALKQNTNARPIIWMEQKALQFPKKKVHWYDNRIFLYDYFERDYILRFH